MSVVSNFRYKLSFCILIYVLCWPLQHDRSYHLGSPYLVCISPEFSDLQEESIEGGMALWNNMGETHFYNGAGILCDLAVIPVRGAWAHKLEERLGDPLVLGWADTTTNTIYLWIDQVYDLKDLMTLACHEAGHWISMGHLPMSSLAIMNPYRRYYGPGSIHLYRPDLIQYCQHWKCSDIDWAHTDDVVYALPDGGALFEIDR